MNKKIIILTPLALIIPITFFIMFFKSVMGPSKEVQEVKQVNIKIEKRVKPRKRVKTHFLVVDGILSNFFIYNKKIYKKGDSIFNVKIRKIEKGKVYLENGDVINLVLK